jgi:Rac GTPase-activating protein 1
MKQTDNEDNLADAIEELPEPNRDTLAYLCLHLQKVAMNAAQNKMTVENLAVCLSPTILGNNGDALNTLGYAGSNGNPFDEVARQRVVLERLLKMPTVSSIF